MTEFSHRVISARYGRLSVFDNDIGAATKSLSVYGEWAENEISFLKQFVQPGSTVLDIGAYIGTHTLAFANFVGPTGRVIAVEAQPDTFEVLRANIALNTAPAGNIEPGVIELRNAVAASELGTVLIPTIHVELEGSFGSASLSEMNAAGAAMDQAQVAALTIDSLDLKQCSLIKIDVEGLEEIVLRGAVQTLQRFAPIVYCECNDLASGLKTVTVLKEVHYKTYGHVVDAFNPTNYFENSANIFDDGREVAIFGVPESRVDLIQTIPLRPIELLLEIHEADDLALALLNKPQYQSEVLLVTQAAKTGGDRFLNSLASGKIELERLQNENSALHTIRAEERETLSKLEAEATAFRDRISALQRENESLLFLREQNQEQAEEITGLHRLLTERDVGIVKLQDTLKDLLKQLAQLQVNFDRTSVALAGREADIADLREELRHKDAALLRANAAFADIVTSKSWKITAPLRWVLRR